MRNAGENDQGRGPTNWAFVDQKLMETFSYTLPQLWELTLPEIATHMEKLTPTCAEPEWFVKAWRGAKTDREKLEALAVMMEQ